MAPKPKPWFRFYVEAMHDRKLRRLKPEHRWLWVAVLAAARQSPAPGELRISNGDPMDADDLADLAALTVKQVDAGLALFTKSDMLIVEDGVYRVVAWDARQYESDTSTERSKRSRQRRKQQEGDDDATLHSRPMQRCASITENRVQSTYPPLDSENHSDRDPEPISEPIDEAAAPEPTPSPEPDEQTIRRTASLIGRHVAANQAGIGNPAAYATKVTRDVLEAPDGIDRQRITRMLTEGQTPEAIAEAWGSDPFGLDLSAGPVGGGGPDAKAIYEANEARRRETQAAYASEAAGDPVAGLAAARAAARRIPA